LHYYVYPEDSANAVYDFANTPDMVDYYCDTFGAYPFEMYGMAEAQIFNGWGAMEHQTVTTYGYNLIDGFGTYEWIVAHELSHMWWGDCLSPLTFADIWLNEGFATYSEALCMDFFYNNLQENMANKAQSYFWEDQYARYAIYNPPPAYLFGSAVYDKGAWVQHMLRYIIGDSAFFAGLQNYFLHHQYGNVITAEYQAENEEVSGMDLDWYFDEWVYQAGYPEYEYSWTVEMVGSNFLATVYLEQVQNNAPIFTMPIEFLFSYAEEETLITVWNDQQNQAFQFTLNFIPYDFGFDPNEKILKSSTQVSVSEIPIGSPYSFALDGNYPNPFNASTEIKFSIDHPGKVTLSIYNSMGQKLAVLVNENLAAGEYSRVWEANNISSGIYWMVLSNKQKTEIKKMILLK
jgi:aminopeptidase N